MSVSVRNESRSLLDDVACADASDLPSRSSATSAASISSMSRPLMRSDGLGAFEGGACRSTVWRSEIERSAESGVDDARMPRTRVPPLSVTVTDWPWWTDAVPSGVVGKETGRNSTGRVSDA